MIQCHFWLIALCIFPVVNGVSDRCQHQSCYPVTGNLLLGRKAQLKSTSTCGLRFPEPYCIVSHLEDRKKCFRCDSRHPWIRYVNEQSHRVENVISDNPDIHRKNWWQSVNGVQNVSLQLNLEAEFHFTHLIMTFRSFRPAAMLVERSSDYGKTWRVYRYFAFDCQESFPGVPEASSPRKHNDVICDARYSKVEPSTGGEVVFKVLSPQIQTKDPFAPEIQDLLRVTNLRINFTKLHTLGDNLLDNRPEISEKYYYAIYDMVVRGSCSCYGHAQHCIPGDNGGVQLVDGTKDRIDMIYGRCQCTHNTKGMNCEECEDFYNDVPWRPAVDREINACRPCECNGHATRCHFDKSVYEASNFVSGGVCDNCQHNTVGKNCEQCKPYFYREPGRQVNDPYGCRACECDLRGSLNQGICDSETDPEHNLIAGKCHCKKHVDGDRCDRCQHGFWKLDQSSEEGCAACTCYLLGTYGNEGCNKQTGECTCKRLVTGDNCDRCLPEHYGLSDDVEGCKTCDCDLGGALDNQCDITSGQCKCRPHFTGRRCDSPESGFYCVNLDHFTFEAEDAHLLAGATVEHREPVSSESKAPQTWTGAGFAKLREGGQMDFTVDGVQSAMNYHFVVRFESHLADSWQNVDVRVTRPGLPSPDGPCKDAVPKDDFMRAVLYPGGRYYEVPESVCLEPGVEYKVKVSLGEYKTGFSDRRASVLIDSLVLIPSTTSLPIFNEGSPTAERRRLEFSHYQCRQAALDAASRDRLHREPCAKFACPLAASLMESGQECRCDPTGSNSGICSPHGGSCDCKPNVEGRRCERCAPGTYGFGPQGCTDCGCNSVGSLDNFCDLRTGQCKCRDGVYGRQCDQCQPGFWGFPTCRQCECNGHADICDQESGACIECREMTASYYCDRCQEGFYGDPRIGVNIGCRPCPCPGGPGSGFQHADTCYLDPPTQNVVCNCKQGYVGERCEQCGLNYWGGPNEIGGSCERCDCNNNIDFSVPESCDKRTGRCQKCLHFTEGFQCEDCVAGYFGDAKIQQCSKCVCNVLGTDQSAKACERVSGQCPCLPNVHGLRCDTCAPNHWNLASAAGCEQCSCDPIGVLVSHENQPQLQCNEFDGQCTCKPGRGGRTCGECEDYYWGDPRVECKRCQCNPEGSTTLQCHRENGTCSCQPGSGGPRCDQCARGYTGTWPKCYPCGECFQNWDRILSGLKNETDYLIEQASNMETTGVASVYDVEFKIMEEKLTNISDQLKNANLTRSDVDNLSAKIKRVEKSMDDARHRLTVVDQRVTEHGALVDTADARLRALRGDSRRLAEDSAAFERNATRLRESDVEGAFNVTREALAESREAARSAVDSDRLSQESAALRRRTADKLTTYAEEFEQQFQGNQKTLDELSVGVGNLSQRVPSLNAAVCGAAGDPCDDLCGGAKCEKCGGPSCGEGAVTKSERAFQYSKEANEKLNEKQRQANDLMHQMRVAQQLVDRALVEARQAHQTASRVAQQANETRGSLKRAASTLDSFLANGGGDTLNEIRTITAEIFNMTISEDPTEIENLSQAISENLAKLTNIDEILAETRANLTIAQRLKENADSAKIRAETMLNTTHAVVGALSNAKDAQQKAKVAIDQANIDINSARVDLSTIASETETAENSSSVSTQSLTSLKKELNEVEVDYLNIEKDAERANLISQSAKAKLEEADRKKVDLETKYGQSKEALNQKLGAGQAPKEKAERIRQRATNLLENTQKHLADIEAKNLPMDLKKSVGSLKSSDVEVTLEDQSKINKFARLNQRLDEVKTIVKLRKRAAQDLSYACDEILLQDDENASVPILIGDAFISYNQADAQEELEKLKLDFELEVADLNKQVEGIRAEMANLKTDLYAKFGSSINLEAEDDAMST